MTLKKEIKPNLERNKIIPKILNISINPLKKTIPEDFDILLNQNIFEK